MNTYLPAYKERAFSMTEKIWFAMLFTFIFDSVTAAYAPVRHLLLNPYSHYILCALLISALILNSRESLQNLNSKISQIQSKTRNSGSRYALIFYLFISAFIFFELFSRFGIFIFQNLLLLTIACAVFAISIGKTIKEKLRHDLLMKTDRNYFLKQQSIQNMLIALLPAILSRAASLIAAAHIYNSTYTYTDISMYFIAMFLFFESYSFSE